MTDTKSKLNKTVNTVTEAANEAREDVVEAVVEAGDKVAKAVNETVAETVAEVSADAREAADKLPEPLKVFIEHQKRAFEETGKAIEALLPDGFKTHSKEARREFLKGMTVLVDAAVGELEKASKEADKLFKRVQKPTEPVEAAPRPSTTGAQKVKVQVE